MSKTVSDFVLDRLSDWGVKRVFGYPGDGIDGLLHAFARKGHGGLKFTQVRHEEMAAFMACAHAKFTGEVGVCMATGSGAIHLLNGLYDAKMDHQPVVAIIGQQTGAALGGDYQHEVDLVNLFKGVANEFVAMATTPEQVRPQLDRALRVAIDQRSVTCVILPSDLQTSPSVEPARTHSAAHHGIGHTFKHVVPSEIDLAYAAEILNDAKRVALLVGAGAMDASDEVIELAELLGAGIAKALLGKAVVPDDLPFVTGVMGPLGNPASSELMDNCDTLLIIGSNFPYSEFLPKEGKARGLQIDMDGRHIGLHYPVEIGLIGDSCETLRALIPYLDRKEDRSWRTTVERNVTQWWKTQATQALDSRNDARGLINPQRVFWELSSRLPGNAIITADSGSSATWYARDIKLRKGMMASLSGGLATMGSAVPYAIAAKYAYPSRPVIAVAGDGAMQMNGLNELITIARSWRDWKSPHLIVLILNNRDLNKTAGGRRTDGAEGADTGLPDAQSLAGFPYAAYARLIGLAGIRVERGADLASSWDAALAADRPAVLEILTDPDVPPLPLDVARTQERTLTSALLRRDTNAASFIMSSAREWLAGALPGRH